MTELSRRSGVDTTSPDGADIVLTIRDVASLGDNLIFELSPSDSPEFTLNQVSSILNLLNSGWRCVDQHWVDCNLLIALRLAERQVEAS
ncbi:hypothetical protein D3C74_43320 [compost metagenome]